MTSRSKLAWRCRRGTLELDILLNSFFEQEYDHLSPAEQASFEQLLDTQDPMIMDWLWGRAPLPAGELGKLIERIREHRQA